MEQQKKEIIEAGRRLYERGYVVSSDGNISVRLDDKRILTTPAGMNKGELKRDDLVVVDMDGKKLQGRREPSSELNMHLFIYRNRPDVKAIVHAHPPYCTGYATAGIPLDKCVLPEVILTIGSIPLAQYATPSTEEVAESLKPYIADSQAVLLANHGAVTFGKDVMDAYRKLERIEHAAHISFVSHTLGGQRILPEEQVKKLEDIRSASPDAGPAPKCQSCVDCVGDSCVNHPYKQETPTPPESDIRDIVRKVLSKM